MANRNPRRKNRQPSILLAFGGHVLEFKESEFRRRPHDHPVATRCMKAVVELLKRGYEKIVITHGNGPQVGKIFLQQHLLRKRFPNPTTLDVCVADTQGRIGYALQRIFDNLCVKSRINKKTSTVITQVVVNRKDKAFRNPTKPIGLFYTKAEAQRLRQKNGWVIKFEPGRGYRRVVASPEPHEIVERKMFLQLLKMKYLAIGAGGGGIPVVRDAHGILHGIEAVIDKDKTSALLASICRIHTFVILTEVPEVCLFFGTSQEKPLHKVRVPEMKRYLRDGHFHEGSMKPKVEAAIRFIEGGGKRAIITSIDFLFEALHGEAGTHILK